MKKLIISLTLILLTVLPANSQYISSPSQTPDPQDAFCTIFTPQTDGTQFYISYVLAHTHEQLLVADFTFTSQPITDLYCGLAKRGIKVFVILDRLESRAVKKEAPLIAQMTAAGVTVIITTSPVKHKIMHNKFSICDSAWVIDGSWNYSSVADDEANEINCNIVPSPKRAALFRQAWESLYYFAKNQ
jgi:phosphatidylserine/phosphatidylglycerophosphate/cardiolipin synthase-like enzyme